MTWLSHQGLGFFGFNPDGSPRWCRERKDEEGQPLSSRWIGSLDPEEALMETGDIHGLFFRWRELEVAPFSGGFLEWPKRLADGLAFCRQEWAVVMMHLQSEARKGKPRG